MTGISADEIEAIRQYLQGAEWVKHMPFRQRAGYQHFCSVRLGAFYALNPPNGHAFEDVNVTFTFER